MADQLQFRGGTTAQVSAASVASREIIIDTDTEQIAVGPSKKKTVMEDSSGRVDIPGTLDVTGAATFDSTASFPLGTAALPSLYPGSDVDTGLYSPGANQLAISTNGIGRLFVNSSGNVGIGNASPGNKLEIFHGTVGTGNNSNNALALRYNATTLYGQHFMDNSGRYQIRADAQGVSGGNLALGADNTVQVWSGSTPIERLRITSTGQLSHIGGGSTGSPAVGFNGSAPSNSLVVNSSGAVGIGTSSPSGVLHAAGSSPDLFIQDTQTHTTSDGPLVQFQGRGPNATNYNFGYIQGLSTASNNAGVLRFATNSAGVQSVAMTIDSSQRVGIGTTSINAKLEISGNSGGKGLRLSDGENLDISAGQSSNDPARIATGIGSGIQFAVNGNGGEHMRIDSSGRLLVGTSSSLPGDSQLQVEGTGYYEGGASLRRNSNDAGGTALRICKSRGTSNGSFSIVSSGDTLGLVQFIGADGNADKAGAEIRAEVDGTPGANDMPGRLVFSTTADGASSPTERMRIDSSGNLKLGGTLPSVPNITLNADGQASFSSRVAIDRTGSSNCLAIQQSGTDKVLLRANGDALFGGTLPSAPNITLNANGSATFAQQAAVTGGLTAWSDGIQMFSGSSGVGTIAVASSAAAGPGTLTFQSGSTETMRIGSTGDVKIGGTLPSAPNIELKADGSITAAGRINSTKGVLVGDFDANSTTTSGAFINNEDSANGGKILVQSATSDNTYPSIQVLKGTTQQVTLASDGSITAAGTVTANGTVLTSDQRFKENITPANPQLADIEALGAQLKNFDWNADAPSSNGTRQLGLIAQDVETVCPGIVKTIARTKQGAELTPEVVVPAVYETKTVPAVLDEEGEVVEAETTEQVLVTEEQVTPGTYEELDDSYKGISHDALIMKLLGAVAELSAEVAALKGSQTHSNLGLDWGYKPRVCVHDSYRTVGS